MKVLVLCAQSPWPPTAGSPLRTWGWLRAAGDAAEIGLVTLARNPEEAEAERALAPFTSWARVIPAPRTLRRRVGDSVRAALRGRPRLAESAREPEMAAVVGSALDTFRPDIVQAEQIAATPYLALARERGLPTLYSAHNVESRILAGHGLRAGWAARTMAHFEARACADATGVVAVSAPEADWLRRHARRIFLLPNAVDTMSYAAAPDHRRRAPCVAFVGHLGYAPNREAARILARDVLPRLRHLLPDVRLLIAGREPAADVRRLGHLPGVEMRGPVDDVRAVLGEADVFACPLRRGAGSRLKLLEAAAAGVPVVSSRFGAEGLCLEPGRHFLAAETAAETAEAVLRLVREPEAARTLSRAAREAVQQHHDWDGLRPLIARIYDATLADHHRS